MADLGAIGFAYSYQADDGPWVYGSEENYGPVILPLLSVAPASYIIHSNTPLPIDTINGVVYEDDVPVPNAKVTLTFPRKYGGPSAFSQLVVGTFYDLVPEVVRTVVTNANGEFSFFDIRDNEEYIVTAYN